jgi:hypothetical protein
MKTLLLTILLTIPTHAASKKVWQAVSCLPETNYCFILTNRFATKQDCVDYLADSKYNKNMKCIERLVSN